MRIFNPLQSIKLTMLLLHSVSFVARPLSVPTNSTVLSLGFPTFPAFATNEMSLPIFFVNHTGLGQLGSPLGSFVLASFAKFNSQPFYFAF